jgi:deoxyadenosine/deoxycytidine kinase
MHISIEANIGAGKSTLLAALAASTSKWNVVLEPTDEWKEMLPLFYENKERWSFAFQMQVLLSFLHEDRSPCVVTERSSHACRYVFGDMLHREGYITGPEWKIFEAYHDTLTTRPSVLIYVKTTPEACYERIQTRNDGIMVPLEYLRQVHEQYERMVATYHGHVYTVDGIQTPEKVLEDVHGILMKFG